MAVHMFSGGTTRRIHRVGLSVRAVNVNDGCIIYAELGQGQHKQGYSSAAKTASQQALDPWLRFFQFQQTARQQASGK